MKSKFNITNLDLKRAMKAMKNGHERITSNCVIAQSIKRAGYSFVENNPIHACSWYGFQSNEGRFAFKLADNDIKAKLIDIQFNFDNSEYDKVAELLPLRVEVVRNT